MDYKRRMRGADLAEYNEIGYSFLNMENRNELPKVCFYSPDYDLLDTVKGLLLVNALDVYKIRNAKDRKKQRDTWEITFPLGQFEEVKEVLKPWLRVYPELEKKEEVRQ